MRSREKRVENTDQIKTENQRLNDQNQLVDDEWNRVMSDQKNIERLVEKKLEERENFLRMPPASNHIDLMNIGHSGAGRYGYNKDLRSKKQQVSRAHLENEAPKASRFQHVKFSSSDCPIVPRFGFCSYF